MHRDLAVAVAAYADLSAVRDVLDVATGTGLVLRALRERREELRLTGTDISPGMLEVARDSLPDATWVEADAAALPIADRSVDLNTCVTALHAIPDAPAALAEWRRVLRPGGYALTATFVEYRGAAPAPQRIPYPSDHVPFSSLERLQRTAETAGFAIARSTNWIDGDDELLIAKWTPIAAVSRAADGSV